jgi:hypothetical protein
MRFATHVDDLAPLKGDDDESVERLEVHGDHREKSNRMVLGGDDGARGEESQYGCNYVAKKVDRPSILGPVASLVQPGRARAP